MLNNSNASAWIVDGEKFALMGLNLKLEGYLPSDELAPGYSVLVDEQFQIPAHWREWLGTIRAEELDNCNLYLLSKQRSAYVSVLDAENQALQQRVWHFYIGLLLASPFALAHKPILLTGACRGKEIDLRQHQDHDPPIPKIWRPYPAVVPDNVRRAAKLGRNLETLAANRSPGGHWRLFRTLRVYTDARTIPDIVDRIHQYCRCIDGLILPDAGNTKKQFKSRRELFIGPNHHDLMGELYDIRSAVEHLHENRYLENFDRGLRLELTKKEAIAEFIARSALAHVIERDSLWLHFSNTPALKNFREKAPKVRKEIWGDPNNPLIDINDFDPQYITDAMLGCAR